MSNPIFLIIQREFLSRVRKKTFILVTLIGPLAFAALMIVPGLLASMPEDNKRIVVLDEPSLLLPHEGKEQYTLEYLDPRENDLELAKDLLRDSEYDALLYIPSGENWDPDFIKNNILLFGKEDPSMELQDYLDYLLEEQINQAKLLKNGVDPEIVAQIKTNVNIKSFTLGEEGNDEQSAVPIKMALGYITGMLIYFFIFFYSVQVMRGVMEEKSSRIVEVIISSVRPYQLMMGKILGIGLVGVLQFIIWIGLSGVLYTVISTLIFPELFAEQAAAGIAGNPAADTVGLEIMDMLIRSGALDVVVVDSVAALVPRAEIEGEMGDSHMGLQARLMSQALRKITGALHQSKTTAIFINQLREKIGVFFGSPETTTGGKALKFYASIRLDIRRIETLKDGQDAVGNRTRVKVVKNKMAPPFKQAEFDILYGHGISREGGLLDQGAELGIVKKSGAWYTYEGDQLGQGKENSRQFLIDNPDLANDIETKIRAHFAVTEFDPALVAAIDEAAADVDF